MLVQELYCASTLFKLVRTIRKQLKFACDPERSFHLLEPFLKAFAVIFAFLQSTFQYTISQWDLPRDF